MQQTIVLPYLNPSEIYAGIILFEDGSPSHHLILLPGDAEEAPHQVQIDWAKSIGGELPTRQELSLLFANCKQHFKADWYWSGELYAPVSGYAWCQTFSNGYQFTSTLYYKLRARAVRRLPI
jgi:hypothetical protein